MINAIENVKGLDGLASLECGYHHYRLITLCRIGLPVCCLPLAVLNNGYMEPGKLNCWWRSPWVLTHDRYQQKILETIRYFSEFIANYTIGIAIELNPSTFCK